MIPESGTPAIGEAGDPPKSWPAFAAGGDGGQPKREVGTTSIDPAGDLVKERIKGCAAADAKGTYQTIGVAGSFRRDGHKLLATCPFHDDEHESLQITRDGEHAGEWKCFVCGDKGGDIIAFLQKRDGLTFPEALEELARALGVQTVGKGKGKAEKPAEVNRKTSPILSKLLWMF